MSAATSDWPPPSCTTGRFLALGGATAAERLPGSKRLHMGGDEQPAKHGRPRPTAAVCRDNIAPQGVGEVAIRPRFGAQQRVTSPPAHARSAAIGLDAVIATPRLHVHSIRASRAGQTDGGVVHPSAGLCLCALFKTGVDSGHLAVVVPLLVADVGVGAAGMTALLAVKIAQLQLNCPSACPANGTAAIVTRSSVQGRKGHEYKRHICMGLAAAHPYVWTGMLRKQTA
eukprot:CAMPEP_0117513960 /NCGR_PEP_ID=MMETSP0784-20121206/29824_1 /TAXON_ID=39447 /ORGANISM="" /LENGTH=227 /DNA_ID=CAMNT_0005309743 /DNA_START=149 /DNA_END=834 /DNA_ORIENTATION=+